MKTFRQGTSQLPDGFDLGITHSLKPRPPCANSREVQWHPKITQKKLVDKEVKLGHILSRFNDPPFPNMVFSPLNIIPKAGDQDAEDEKKWKLIHDLTFPYNEESVNSCIPEENSSVEYHYIDEVIRMAIAIGTRTCGCRMHAPFFSFFLKWKNLY